jgi:hypothetical protein
MKKKEIKKLQLSRETLVDLKSSDIRTARGGNTTSINTGYSPDSGCCSEDLCGTV